MRKLTPRQQEFCERYLLSSNAAKSAREAGYALSTASKKAYALLRLPQVAAYLERRGRELIDERVNPRRILLELEAAAFSDITDFAAVEQGAFAVRDSADWPAGASRAVAGLHEGVRGVELKLYDKTKALEILGKAVGVFGRDGAHGGPTNGMPEEIEIRVVRTGEAGEEEK